MKTSSAKAKGRRLQQRVRDDMRAIAPQLDPSDIESVSMGVNGVDVILTKAARDVFGELAIECKNVEKLNAVGVFQEHLDKYQPKGKIALMVHSRNHCEPRVTLLWSDFVRLYLKLAVAKNIKSGWQWRSESAEPCDHGNATNASVEDCTATLECRGRKSTSFAVDKKFEPCCDNEQRTMAGGCKNCGDPSL